MNNSKSNSKSRPKTGYSKDNKKKISLKKNTTLIKNKSSSINPKIVNNIKTYRDLMSPKTIEYSKIMEKYGDFLKDNSPKNKKESTERRSDRNNLKTKREIPIYQDDIHKKNYNGYGKYTNITEYEKNNTSNSNAPKSDYINSRRELDNTGKFNPNTNHNINPNTNHNINHNTINYDNQTLREKENIIRSVLEENEELKEEISHLKRHLDREQSKSFRLEEDLNRQSHNNKNISELNSLKERLNYVEKENEELKINFDQNIQATAEKINLFLKLCSKYLKKIKNIFILFCKLESSKLESINEGKEEILHEINQTLEKFNQTIHNPKLLSTLLDDKIDFEIKSLSDDYAMSDSNFFKNELNLIDVIKRLENDIQNLSEQNENLNNHRIELESHHNELNEKSEEISRLKRKFKDETILREEIETSLMYTKQMNKDLESKMNLLEDENKNLKKNFKNLNENMKEKELLKNTNKNLENEIKYKESIINYLETLLKSNNISFSNNKNKSQFEDKIFNEDSEFDFNNSENKFSKNIFKNSKTEDFNLKNFISPKDSFMRNDNENNNLKNFSNYNESKLEQSDEEYRFRPTFNNEIEKGNHLNNSKTSHLKSEIDNLDGEIKHLQNKLKIMIDVNKNK